MTMLNLNRLSLLLLSLLVLSCDRTVDYVPPVADDPEPPAQIFQNNEVTVTEFQVVAEEGDTLELMDSTEYAPTVLIIPENLCVYGNGEPCEGEMDVQLIQAFGKSDMIFNDIPTTTRDMPLESGGAFYLNITQGGEQLYIRPDALFQIKAAVDRTEADSEKMLFYGLEEIETEVYDWRLLGPLANIDEQYYTMEFNQLDRWMNIDYEIPVSVEALAIEVTKEGESLENVDVYFSLDDFNSIGKAEYDQSKASFIGMVPNNSTLQVVALKKEGTDWFFQSSAVSGESSITLDLEPVAYDDLVSLLKKL